MFYVAIIVDAGGMITHVMSILGKLWHYTSVAKRVKRIQLDYEGFETFL